MPRVLICLQFNRTLLFNQKQKYSPHQKFIVYLFFAIFVINDNSVIPSQKLFSVILNDLKNEILYAPDIKYYP